MTKNWRQFFDTFFTEIFPKSQFLFWKIWQIFWEKTATFFAIFEFPKKCPKFQVSLSDVFLKNGRNFLIFSRLFWSKFFENSQKCPKKLHQKFSKIFPKSQFLFWKFFRFFKKICEKTITFLTSFFVTPRVYLLSNFFNFFPLFSWIFRVFSKNFREFFVFFQKIALQKYLKSHSDFFSFFIKKVEFFKKIFFASLPPKFFKKICRPKNQCEILKKIFVKPVFVLKNFKKPFEKFREKMVNFSEKNFKKPKIISENKGWKNSEFWKILRIFWKNFWKASFCTEKI